MLLNWTGLLPCSTPIPIPGIVITINSTYARKGIYVFYYKVKFLRFLCYSYVKKKQWVMESMTKGKWEFKETARQVRHILRTECILILNLSHPTSSVLKTQWTLRLWSQRKLWVHASCTYCSQKWLLYCSFFGCTSAVWVLLLCIQHMGINTPRAFVESKKNLYFKFHFRSTIREHEQKSSLFTLAGTNGCFLFRVAICYCFFLFFFFFSGIMIEIYG